MAEKFNYILMIDDDVILPPDFPIVVDRFTDKVGCIGYSIESTGPNGEKGNIIQQCQDIEYKLSGLNKAFQAKLGSAIFPHGAIILWKRTVILKLFKIYPFYNISEECYFGLIGRKSGYRVDFCSQIFLKTDMPKNLFWPSGGRGGYGEMTVFKQRFYRWNFFRLYRMLTNMHYIMFCWKLGLAEIIVKFYIFQEVYINFIWMLSPITLPMAFWLDWKHVLIMNAIVSAAYLIGLLFFNVWHLRKKECMFSWWILIFYLPYKFALSYLNIASLAYSYIKYGTYFAKKHVKISKDTTFTKFVDEFGTSTEKSEAAKNSQ